MAAENSRGHSWRRRGLSAGERQDLKYACELAVRNGGGIARVGNVSITLPPTPKGAQSRNPRKDAPSPAQPGAASRPAMQPEQSGPNSRQRHSLQRLAEFRKRKQNELYAKCRLRSVLQRVLKRIRWNRMQDVWTAWQREILATRHAIHLAQHTSTTLSEVQEYHSDWPAIED